MTMGGSNQPASPVPMQTHTHKHIPHALLHPPTVLHVRDSEQTVTQSVERGPSWGAEANPSQPEVSPAVDTSTVHLRPLYLITGALSKSDSEK